jgi:hypothetical protein
MTQLTLLRGHHQERLPARSVPLQHPGIANRIACPTLALAGEGDFAGAGQLDTFAYALTAPVTTHEFIAAEGAGGHCEGLGQDRPDQFVYGWLTRTLAERPAPVAV